jgi:hypothetical protein
MSLCVKREEANRRITKFYSYLIISNFLQISQVKNIRLKPVNSCVKV